MRKTLLSMLLLVCCAALVVAASASAKTTRGTHQIAPARAFSSTELYQAPGANWPVIGGSLRDDRYSTLNQINSGNVAGLKTAWQTHLGYKPIPGESAEGNALVYNGVMYITSGLSNVYALDAATGAKHWSRTGSLEKGAESFLLKVNRGLALGDGKLFIAQLDGNVVAMDQLTGKTVWKQKLGRWQEGYAMTTPPSYIDGKLIVGMSGGDWGARSFVVALDAKTGSELWRWYVVPSPGEIGSGSWQLGDWLKGGGAVWIGASYDPETGFYYVVTGNPVPYNGRGKGDNYWTDSIVALHIGDGKMAWGFQTVHHDIWDFDVTNPPVLFDEMIKGKMRKGMAVASKTGWVYVLDRITGKPIIGIPETKVPQGDTYSNTSKTQPIPIGSAFVDQCSKPSNYKALAPDGKKYKFGCIFTPYSPTPEGSYFAANPSAGGGVDWPPSAYSPQTKYIYVCATEGGGALGAIPNNQQQWVPGDVFKVVGINFGSSLSTHGVVAAINVTTNKLAWKLSGKKDGWPTNCYSGMLATAGNLVFAGHSEGIYSAYSASSGRKLWDSPKLPGGPNAPGISYSVNGKQYVSVFAGGGAGKQSDVVVAFAMR